MIADISASRLAKYTIQYHPAPHPARRPQRRGAEQAPGLGHHRLGRCAPEHPRHASPQEVDDQGLGLSAKWSCDHQHILLTYRFLQKPPCSSKFWSEEAAPGARAVVARDPVTHAASPPALTGRAVHLSSAAFPVGSSPPSMRRTNQMATLTNLRHTSGQSLAREGLFRGCVQPAHAVNTCAGLVSLQPRPPPLPGPGKNAPRPPAASYDPKRHRG